MRAKVNQERGRKDVFKGDDFAERHFQVAIIISCKNGEYIEEGRRAKLHPSSPGSGSLCEAM